MFSFELGLRFFAPLTTLRINSEIMVGQGTTLPLQGISNDEVRKREVKRGATTWGRPYVSLEPRSQVAGDFRNGIELCTPGIKPRAFGDTMSRLLYCSPSQAPAAVARRAFKFCPNTQVLSFRGG